jgi:LysR family glycine cleavage system transcriptional activator
LLKRGPPLRKPADLAHHTLLHSIARPDDWAHWLKAAGVANAVDAHAGMTYESSAFAYAAAAEGHGIAIAQRFLIEDDLASGKLKMPFKEQLDMGNYTYYLVTPQGRTESPQMRVFRTWLLEQLRSE